MTIFLLATAAMFAIAFWLILPPLMKKHDVVVADPGDENIHIGQERLRELKAELEAGQIDNAQFEQMRTELEQTVLDAIEKSKKSHVVGEQKNHKNLWVILALTVGIPVVALGIYNHVGTTVFLDQQLSAKSEQTEEGVPDVEAMVVSLAKRLEENPEDGEGWKLLGRSYMVMQRFEEASKAYGKAYEILGENADLLVNYADAIGRSENSDLTGSAKPFIRKALELEPDHGKARWMTGMLAYQEQNFEKAISYLEPLLAQLESGSEAHQAINMLVTRVKEKLAGNTSAPPLPPEHDQQQIVDEVTSSESVTVQVRVRLDESLRGQVGADDTLFVFARASADPPIPLAVARLRAGDLPLTVTLDDSMAMQPNLKISGYDRVNIGARISKTGNAIAATGDLQGETKEVITAAAGTTEITINQLID